MLAVLVLAALASPICCIKLRFQGEECLSYTFNQVSCNQARNTIHHHCNSKLGPLACSWQSHCVTHTEVVVH